MLRALLIEMTLKRNGRSPLYAMTPSVLGSDLIWSCAQKYENDDSTNECGGQSKVTTTGVLWACTMRLGAGTDQ